VQSMLEHLVFESGTFFKQLDHLSKDPRYHPAIASAALVPRIVKDAKPKVKELESDEEAGWEIGDEKALSVLVEIAKSSKCKPAIAEAGGIAELVEIYQLLKMTEDAFDANIVNVVSALAGLAEDTMCQEQFAAARGEWALLDFLWKCSTTETWRYIEDERGEHIQCLDNDGYEVDATELTKFTRATVLPAEAKAGRALWALAELGVDWKWRVLYLGELYIKSSNMNLDNDNPDALSGCEDWPQFDAVCGWLRMSNFIGEKEKRNTDRTHWSVPTV